MRASTFVLRSLAYHWRVNAAVVLGVAVAVAVLAGALVVGDSVRASLKRLFLDRLGRADHLIAAPDFFREELAAEIAGDEEFSRAGFVGAIPLVTLEGVLTHEASGRRAGRVQVYGVDERFWRFHGIEAQTLGGGEALMSPALAEELGASAGDQLLLRVEKPSDIPIESLHGRKDDVGSTARLRAGARPSGAALGEFSLRAGQGVVRSVFVPLEGLRGQIGRDAEANAILVSAAEGSGDEAVEERTAALRSILKRRFTPDDQGVRLRVLASRGVVAFETKSGILNDEQAAAVLEAARRAGLKATPILSYLANFIRTAEREVPYSVVTAVDDETLAHISSSAASESAPHADGTQDVGRGAEMGHSSIILNEWTARDLGAEVGEHVTLEYYVWEESGRLVTRSAEFSLAAVVPIAGAADDRDLVPDYPGITGAESVSDWDPPFPLDLSRIRPQDETYWDQHRATPKAFIPLARGQQLWGTRFGKVTSYRLAPPAGASAEAALESFRRSFAEVADPAQAGVAVLPVRAEGLKASEGATDFGEYFFYFSFFLVVSALLLAALFFRLGVEQRLREIGVLRAIGFSPARVSRLFVTEGLALAAAGALLGMGGAYLYGAFVMHGLRTWWVGAVGTTALELHPTAWPFAAGAAGGILAAVFCVVVTLRGLRRASVRALLHGSALEERESGTSFVKRLRRSRQPTRSSPLSQASRPSAWRRFSEKFSRTWWAGVWAAVAGGLLLLAAVSGLVGPAAGFFGGGTLLLLALLCFQAAWLGGRAAGSIGGHGPAAIWRLGVRNATHRPGRSILCITLIAAASFIVVAVDAFRRDGPVAAHERKSGTGGYALLAETLLPIVHDPNTAEGREALNLSTGTSAVNAEGEALDGVSFARFRLRPGDDASCLNLYRPRNPRVLGASDDFVRQNRFVFRGTLADATREEKENPWLLLRRRFEDGAVPVIADANSLAYVLHLKLGEDFLLERGGREPLRLRVVAALADSVLQGELLMAEENFTRLFPEEEGYRLLLIETPGGDAPRKVAETLEETLADYGFDAQSTAERLAGFHRVENTYLSTFQMLGGLGLALGTLGLAAVLLRNVFERRRELALLRAVGYGRRQFALMAVAENGLLLLCGVVTGTLCALLAIAPAVAARGGAFPFAAIAALLLAVVAAGLLASLLATAAVLRSPLIPSLRAE
jgi:ABC-type lipoprotein release transport system permease subunit